MSEYVSIRGEVQQKLETHMPEIRERFGIETLGLFGSVSRGEDTPESDVDILYLFSPGRGGMHDMSMLLDYLRELFQRDVGLVSVKYISPFMRECIVGDAIFYGNNLSLV